MTKHLWLSTATWYYRFTANSAFDIMDNIIKSSLHDYYKPPFVLCIDTTMCVQQGEPKNWIIEIGWWDGNNIEELEEMCVNWWEYLTTLDLPEQVGITTDWRRIQNDLDWCAKG